MFCSLRMRPHQWRSGSALNIARREVPGPIPGHACRPSRSVFSVVFAETRVNTDLGSLRKASTESTCLTDPGPTTGQLALIPTINQPLFNAF